MHLGVLVLFLFFFFGGGRAVDLDATGPCIFTKGFLSLSLSLNFMWGVVSLGIIN